LKPGREALWPDQEAPISRTEHVRRNPKIDKDIYPQISQMNADFMSTEERFNP